METWKNSDHFHWGIDHPHVVDPSEDPTNSFLCCHPKAANIYHATCSQEPNIYPPDAPEPKIWKDEWNHEFVADKNGDCGFPVSDKALACKISVPPCFPSPEEQLCAAVSGSEKSLKAGEIGSYYRCMESSCSVKKRVEREATDPGLLLVTTYEGIHNHESSAVIYYIGKPINLPQPPGSKPVIILVNRGVGSEAVMKFASK